MKFLRVTIVLALLACTARAQPPNIVFILCDDLGYGDTGYFFQKLRQAAGARAEPWHFTPRLDALAGEGLQLPHHYCPAPVCAPSRASLLTGVHQGHAHVRDNQFDKALENNHTLATVLRQAGYATACIGKWGLQGALGGAAPPDWPAYPLNRGFDFFHGCIRHGDGHAHYPKEDGKQVWEMTTDITAQLDKCYTTDLFTARAKKWIGDQRAAHPAQPFFLFLAYDTPHAQLQLPAGAYPAGGLQYTGTPGTMISSATGTADSFTHPDYAAATWDDDANAATPEVAWPEVYRRYATDVRRIDDCVGDLVQTLKNLGLDDNTLLVFTTDNGPSKESYLPEDYAPNFFNSFGPFEGIKRDCWEGGIRVGALVRWPGGVPGNRVNNLPCQFHDWLPTFAELAGVAAPARSDGVSLVPTLKNLAGQKTPRVYVEYFEGGTTPNYGEFQAAKRGRDREQMQMIRAGDFVGVRYHLLAHADPFEIYHIVADPGQRTNLAASQPALQQEMKDTVLRVRRPGGGVTRPYDAELVPGVAAAPVTPGVEWRAFAAAFPWVPELASLTPSSSGRATAPTLAVRPRDNDIAMLFSGYVNVPADGSYTFFLNADTAAFLRIHEAQVLDADFGYSAGSEIGASISLKAGKHPFRLSYMRRTAGAPALALAWSGPGFAKQPMPESAFLRDGTGPPLPPVANADAAATARATPVDVAVLANDAPPSLIVQSAGPAQHGTTAIVGAGVRYTPDATFLGTDTFSYTASDGAQTASATVSVSVTHFDGSYWFPFNQLSGTTTLAADGWKTATLNGFTADPAQWVAGRADRALSFDNVDDFVSVDGFTGILGSAARSCVAWVKTSATGGNKPIIAWGPNTNGAKWIFLMNSAGQLRVEISNGLIVGTRAINDGQWHHVACTFANDGTPNVEDVKLYMDGALEAVSSVTPLAIATTASGNVKIGGDIQNRVWSGAMDEARIYNRALTPAEIGALAAETNSAALAWHRRFFPTAPIAWTADDDADGFPRLLEYALGGQPFIRETALYAPPALAADRFRWSLPRRRPGTASASYAIECSRDLTAWNIAVAVIATAPLDADFETATYEASPPVSGEMKLFLRLRTVPP